MADDIYTIHDRLDHARNLAEGADPALSVGLLRQVAMQIGDGDLYTAGDILAGRPGELDRIVALGVIDDVLAVLRRRMKEVEHASDGNQLWRRRRIFELVEDCRLSEWREGKVAYALAFARAFGLDDVAEPLQDALQAEDLGRLPEYVDAVNAAWEAALGGWSRASSAA